jgi:hypothetical protein
MEYQAVSGPHRLPHWEGEAQGATPGDDPQGRLAILLERCPCAEYIQRVVKLMVWLV